ncbi:hypothetical protein SASPL_133418 [Salvia splendens]|uniref:Pre-mRNA-splicing factor Syf1/CRNKL1-like C-terminal HAT-repeats domain-containing protein n=1 Tax=Salvia splendens TaxID=180675 RepID=A0A8X8ZJ36_SALSN|nr:hypothetical protein SASPL_133418 [Salvia splendens]
MKNGEIARARNCCYERPVNKLGDDEEAEELFVAFAEFEEKCKETERARCIYKFALDHIPKGRAEELYKKFVAFEKQYGDREGIEDAIVGKRRFQYEDEVGKNPLNYDVWFDYIRLEESCGNRQRIEDVYERAIGNLPPAQEKRYWQHVLDAQDVDRTRDIYNLCLKMIPHEKFSFAKIWLMAAQFEIRQLNIDRARDRIEMHKNIGDHRNEWNSLFLNSINALTLAAATMAGIASMSKGDATAVALSSTAMYVAATGMLSIVNKIQPPQLAVEQRNATRLFKQLHNQIQIILSIGNPNLIHVKEFMDKVLALDRAFPLPLLGAMLDKFPATVEPALWWPHNGRKQPKTSKGYNGIGDERSCFDGCGSPLVSHETILWNSLNHNGRTVFSRAYIDFEISESEYGRTRGLYERLLNRTKHLKVWISYAKFEASAMEEVLLTVNIRKSALSEPEVQVLLPKKLKKRRHIETEDGPAGYEESQKKHRPPISKFWKRRTSGRSRRSVAI